MNKLTRFSLAVGLLCSTFHVSHAQKWSCTAHIGTTAYIGDVNEGLLWQPNLNRTAIGASIGYKALDFMTLRLNVLTGQLSGSDAENATTLWRKQRAFSFKTAFVETAVLTEWNVGRMLLGDWADELPLSAHLVVGVGVSHITPKVDFNEPNPISERTRLDKNAVFNRNQVVIPFGLAAKWPINASTAFRVEATMRKTFSDYFDGVSQAASAQNNDMYGVLTVAWEQTLSWGLTHSEKLRVVSSGAYCPTF